MKYQKKNLWFLASAGMLSLAFVSGCGEENGTTTTTTTTTTTGPTTIPGGDTYNLRKWAKVESADIGGATAFGRAVASKNNKWLYVSSNKGFQAADISDFKSGIAKKWSANLIKDTGTGLSGTGAGNAIFESNKETGVGEQPYRGLELNFMRPSENGVVVSVNKKHKISAKSDFGVFSFGGDKILNAWDGTSDNIKTGNFPSDVISANVTIYPFVLAGAGEYLYVTTRSGYDYIGLGNLGPNLIDKAVRGPEMEFGDIGYVVGAGNRHKFLNPWLAQEKAGEPAYIVDQKGVRVLPADKLGKAYDFSVSADDFKKLAADPKVGSDVWGGEAVAIKDVAMAAGKLYISVPGGVAVYDAKNPGTVFDSKTWANTALTNLAVDGDNVWAVTKTALFAVGTDGKKGQAMGVSVVAAADRKKDGNYDEVGVDGTSLPKDKINGAVFVDGNLVISTGDGLIFSTKEAIKL